MIQQLNQPLQSLENGNWFKLICGASYQHLPAIRNLALTYSLAGADCIDVAADKAVISAAKQGIAVASKLNSHKLSKPLLMVSLNDGEDPHFRKAQFDSNLCPVDCARPCEAICPARAIEASGVVDSLCYGCGRCLPICPQNLILTRSYVSQPQVVIPWISELGIEAIELHTQVEHYEQFARLWKAIRPAVKQLKVLAISCPIADGVIEYLRSLYQLISPLPCPLIWQTDGRPMSGDIGAGTTHAAVKYAQQAIAAKLPGYIQLAGGTNSYTVDKLRSFGMLQQKSLNSGKSKKKVAGVAYGSYARTLLNPIWERLEQDDPRYTAIKPNKTLYFASALEEKSQLLQQAVALAQTLVNPLKNHASRNQDYI